MALGGDLPVQLPNQKVVLAVNPRVHQLLPLADQTLERALKCRVGLLNQSKARLLNVSLLLEAARSARTLLLARKVIQVNRVVPADYLVFARTSRLLGWLLLLLLVELGGQIRLQRGQVSPKFLKLGALLVLSLLGSHHVLELVDLFCLLRELGLFALVDLTLQLDHVLLESLKLKAVVVGSLFRLLNFALQVCDFEVLHAELLP